MKYFPDWPAGFVPPKLKRFFDPDSAVERLEFEQEPEGRKVWGTATTPTITSNRQSSNPRGCIARIPTPLLFGHARVTDADGKEHRLTDEQAEIGLVYGIEKTAAALKFKAVLHDSLAADHAWKLIESGEVRCVSIGHLQSPATKIRGAVDGVKFYDEWVLRELSLCRQGANPDAVIAGFAEE